MLQRCRPGLSTQAGVERTGLGSVGVPVPVSVAVWLRVFVAVQDRVAVVVGEAEGDGDRVPAARSIGAKKETFLSQLSRRKANTEK